MQLSEAKLHEYITLIQAMGFHDEFQLINNAQKDNTMCLSLQ